MITNTRQLFGGNGMSGAAKQTAAAAANRISALPGAAW